MMGGFGRRIRVAVVAAVLMAGAVSVIAQDEGEPSLQTPRNNVKGGAVSARRPGLWVQQGIAFTKERHDVMLKEFGGATPIAKDAQTPSLGETMKLAFLQGLFDMLNQLADQLLLAIQASQVIDTSTADTST